MIIVIDNADVVEKGSIQCTYYIHMHICRQILKVWFLVILVIDDAAV